MGLPISPAVQPGDAPVRFDRDGRCLFVARTADDPPRIERIDLTAGERSIWRELRPPEPSGIIHIGGVVVAAGGDRYAYSYLRSMSDLYLVGGDSVNAGRLPVKRVARTGRARRSD